MSSSYLDDVALVRLFIEGQAHLAANEKLRVQSALDTEQLLARNGQILAIGRLERNPPEVRVRPESSYTELISKVLQAHDFIPIEIEQPTGFIRYEYHAVPEGYQLHHEPARILWRQWWLRYRNGRPRLAEMELIMFVKGSWCPIRNIIFNHSTLFVTTHRGETAHQGGALLVWAEKEVVVHDEPTQFLTAAQVQGRAVPAHTPKPKKAASQKSPAASPTSEPHPPAPITPVLSRHLRQVVRREGDKLYIKTALGEVVVEGSNLRCQFHKNSAQAGPQSRAS